MTSLEPSLQAGGSRVDVAYQVGDGAGAAVRPLLAAVDAVVGRDVQDAVHLGQVARGRVGGAGVDVLDQLGAQRGAVALPQLDAVHAVVGSEVDHVVHFRQEDDIG